MPYTWDIQIPLHSLSKLPVCFGLKIDTDDIFMSPGHVLYHGVKNQTDDIFMSPGHILVPVHTKLAGSLGHTDTFTFCIKIPSISWHQDGVMKFVCPQDIY